MKSGTNTSNIHQMHGQTSSQTQMLETMSDINLHVIAYQTFSIMFPFALHALEGYIMHETMNALMTRYALIGGY